MTLNALNQNVLWGKHLKMHLVPKSVIKNHSWLLPL